MRCLHVKPEDSDHSRAPPVGDRPAPCQARPWALLASLYIRRDCGLVGNITAAQGQAAQGQASQGQAVSQGLGHSASFLLNGVNCQQAAGPVGGDAVVGALLPPAGGGGARSRPIPAAVATLPMRFTIQQLPKTVLRVLKLLFKGNLLCVGFIFKHHHFETLKLSSPLPSAMMAGSCCCPEAGWRRGGQGMGVGAGGRAALLAQLPSTAAAPCHAGGPMPPSPPHCSPTCCLRTGCRCDKGRVHRPAAGGARSDGQSGPRPSLRPQGGWKRV